MITDKLENMHRYQSLFSRLRQLVAVVNAKSLDGIIEKENRGYLSLIPIRSDVVPDTFDPRILEAHQREMDVHITLEGTDCIAYADLETETLPFKAYDAQHDYLLVKSDAVKTLLVPKGYFCIIPNNFAHMALYSGHKKVKKVVVKLVVAS